MQYAIFQGGLIMDNKLLLVDDEEGIRKVLGITLSDIGYKVFTAETGEQALKIFREETPPIVLTDIKMPGMGGIELLQKIKHENPDTEVIMITGHGDMDLAIKSLKYRAVDFVTKPINDEVLEIALNRAHEKIQMREKLREYTENLEELVREKSAKLVAFERQFAVDQTVEGLSAAMRNIAGDLEGGINYLNEMPCFVSIHNRDLKVVAANQLYRDRLGNKSGADSWEVYAGESGERGKCPSAQTFKNQKGQRTKASVKYTDGKQTPVIVHTAPIRNQGGEVELVVEIAVDIAEVKRLKTQVRQLQDHLSSLGLKIGSITHGIKSLLTGLDGGMYLVDTGFAQDDPDRVRDGWDAVKTMVGRIRILVQNILFFAKERELKWERINVFDFVCDVASGLESKIKAQGIDFECNFDQSLGEFEIDPGVVRIALINILENALDACLEDDVKKSHQIAFSAAREKRHIIFEITDNGIGMDRETRENLFTLFFSSKGNKGTGLGLFIAKKIIEQHGGRISVVSKPGSESRFKIELPTRFPASI
jgi:signal transduction histidine kinase/FixJ family two-component response regulator